MTAGTSPEPTADERAWAKDDLPPEVIRAIDLAIDRGARGPVVLRVTELAGYTDWVVIVSGRSDRQVRSVIDGVERGLRGEGRKPLGSDGTQEGLWAILDYDDFIFHAFYHPVRTYYDLESMWSDAPRVALDLPDDVLDTADLAGLSVPGEIPDYRGSVSFGGFADEFDDDDDDEPLFDD
jgi:ribosome-associated protein